jgi:hypothetical protein
MSKFEKKFLNFFQTTNGYIKQFTFMARMYVFIKK